MQCDLCLVLKYKQETDIKNTIQYTNLFHSSHPNHLSSNNPSFITSVLLSTISNKRLIQFIIHELSSITGNAMKRRCVVYHSALNPYH